MSLLPFRFRDGKGAFTKSNNGDTAAIYLKLRSSCLFSTFFTLYKPYLLIMC